MKKLVVLFQVIFIFLGTEFKNKNTKNLSSLHNNFFMNLLLSFHDKFAGYIGTFSLNCSICLNSLLSNIGLKLENQAKT